jgi:hydrogenase expression/formation protein HypE
VQVPPLAGRVCRILGLNPLATIASGALLLTCQVEDAAAICRAVIAEGIACAEIGRVEDGPPVVWQEGQAGREPLPRPQRDEIGKVYENEI